MAEFWLKKGDRQPPIKATLLDSQGTEINLTQATGVTFRMRNRATRALKSGTATITNAALGQVEYRWAAGDTDTVGVYLAEWVVAWSDGTSQVVPNRAEANNVVRVEEPLA